MYDRQFEKDPSYFCFGCHREGTMSEHGSGEKIRTCERCGLKFCHYCGHVDESTLSFLCNECWKERANGLVRINELDQAMAIPSQPHIRQLGLWRRHLEEQAVQHRHHDHGQYRPESQAGHDGDRHADPEHVLQQGDDA